MSMDDIYTTIRPSEPDTTVLAGICSELGIEQIPDSVAGCLSSDIVPRRHKAIISRIIRAKRNLMHIFIGAQEIGFIKESDLIKMNRVIDSLNDYRNTSSWFKELFLPRAIKPIDVFRILALEKIIGGKLMVLPIKDTKHTKSDEKINAFKYVHISGMFKSFITIDSEYDMVYGTTLKGKPSSPSLLLSDNNHCNCPNKTGRNGSLCKASVHKGEQVVSID